MDSTVVDDYLDDDGQDLFINFPVEVQRAIEQVSVVDVKN